MRRGGLGGGDDFVYYYVRGELGGGLVIVILREGANLRKYMVMEGMEKRCFFT